VGDVGGEEADKSIERLFHEYRHIHTYVHLYVRITYSHCGDGDQLFS